MTTTTPVKSEHIHVRVDGELKARIEKLRRDEVRTESAMVDILLREALDARA